MAARCQHIVNTGHGDIPNDKICIQIKCYISKTARVLPFLVTDGFLLLQVTADVAQLLGDQKVDAILCVAGGWAGGNCSSKGQSSKAFS